MYKGGSRHVRVDATAVVYGEWIGAIIFYIQCARMATAADWLNVTTLHRYAKGHVVLAFYCSDVKSNVRRIELVRYGFQVGCREFDRCHIPTRFISCWLTSFFFWNRYESLIFSLLLLLFILKAKCRWLISISIILLPIYYQ